MEERKKAGKFYLRIATKCPDSADVELLIRIAVRELFGTVVVDEGNHSERYLRHLLHDDPRPGLLRLIYPNSEAADVDTLFYIMTEMHDSWVMSHATIFTNPRYDEHRYRFLPIELIGWDDAKLYYQVLAEILADLGLQNIRAATYEASLRAFYLTRAGQRFANICQRDMTLYDFIRTRIPNEYRALPEPVREALRKNIDSCVTSITYSLRDIWLTEPW